MPESISIKKTRSYSKLMPIIVIVLLFLVILFLTWIYYKSSSVNRVSDKNTYIEPVEDLKFKWLNYSKPEYSFSLLYPESLSIWESEDSGEYSFFMRFEEPEAGTNTYKGIAVGVTRSPLIEEVKRIKEEIAKEGIGTLKKESDILVDGAHGTRLDYEPNRETEGESRSVVVVTRGDYAYSISTVPVQIEKVISGFKFL